MSNATAPGGAHLELLDVGRKFGDVEAVRSVSFALEKGEFVTLLGPSGSGKTTTLNMVAGQLAPTRGSILLEGVDITNASVQSRGMGMVFQNYALFPHMTVEQNVAFPLRMRRIRGSASRTRVGRVLDRVGLGSLGSRYPRQLSGGQQQRVALARALIFDPSVLLMDEPLGALDRKLRKSLQEEIVRTCREAGATVLYVTHDQEEALSMSDRVAIYEGGSIQQYGPPQELYREPVSRFVAEFIGDTNLIPVDAVSVHDEVMAVLCNGTKVMVPREQCADTVGPLCAVIRPEDMRVEVLGRQSASFGAGPAFEGVVRERMYFGANATYLIEVNSVPNVLRVDMRAEQAPAGLGVGERVALTWAATSLRLVVDTAAPVARVVDELPAGVGAVLGAGGAGAGAEVVAEVGHARSG